MRRRAREGERVLRGKRARGSGGSWGDVAFGSAGGGEAPGGFVPPESVSLGLPAILGGHSKGYPGSSQVQTSEKRNMAIVASPIATANMVTSGTTSFPSADGTCR